MSAASPPELELSEPSLESRFSDLRSVRWRMNLGILPSSLSSSVEDLRRVTADSRRRYAGLRRRLLVDPHLTKDGNEAPDLVVDNPLSQNPDSMWGRFFRNAELEKMVDQDLSRLYPEHGSYFQTPACQAMLRRILLLWCLRHPEYGYGQGMHELLAPLLYVLHVDVCCLSHVRELCEDHFSNEFDDMSFQESNSVSNFNFTMTSSPDSVKWGASNYERNSFQGNAVKVSSLDELDPDIRTIVLLTDAYGAEGELGVLLSERFMEHDAYCMFDALMGGAHGAVAMAEYFSPSPSIGSSTGLPPVIEASSTVYHLLLIADSSLYSHLVELGVEPQYFSLRWLRVLFGREFLLEDLLIIWDEIFASSNETSLAGTENEMQLNHRVLSSPRGAFIAAIAVSMLLYVRSSLLAAENATSCLQRLLNFPENVDVRKLIEKAKSLQALAVNTSIIFPSPSPGTFEKSKSVVVRGAYSLTPGPTSPTTPLNLLPESYWEEKWRVLHEAEELKQGSPSNGNSARVKGLTEEERLNLARTESAPSSTTTVERKDSRISVVRKLLEDFEKLKLGRSRVSRAKDSVCLSTDVEAENGFVGDKSEQNGIEENFTCTTEEACVSGTAASEENSSVFSMSTTPSPSNDHHENDLEKSSVASNSSASDRDDETYNMEEQEPCSTIPDDCPHPDSEVVEAATGGLGSNMGMTGKQVTTMKDRKPLGGKFQWFWKFGRRHGEGPSEKGGNMEAQRSADVGDNAKGISSSTADGCSNPFVFNSMVDTTEKNVMGSLNHLGQSMLENIQIIESAFQIRNFMIFL
ncbi:uncharacterized protein LOC131217273 isoform X2 [Magnolia sinica]|uniref:uncharacterized protein LOC131217273 isoform X2 n=1 Tax=Magnolia sinica TaxID=86752 RepID=UPI0026582123|nr:uncharacterized protein LOC131217273 isoform X2 [Magnolia sinica]